MAIAAQIYTVDAEIAALTLPEATGGDGDLTYSLTPPAGMAFDPDTRELSGAPTTAASATDYTLTVRDGDGDTDELVFSVTVRAANLITLSNATLSVRASSATDNSIQLTSTVAWEAAASVGLIKTVDPAEETGTSTNQAITLTYDANTGVERMGTITFTETTAGVNPKFSVVLRVTQRAYSAPTFGSETIASQTYVENRPITALPLPAATGGDGTLTYSLTKQDGSALPAGLSFDSDNRVLSGTPAEGTAAVATAYTYTVTDRNGAVRLTFSITIQEDLMPAFSGAIAAQIYTVDAEIAALTLPEATGGDGTLQYSLTPPDGMTFTEATRVLSGAPTTAAVATNYTLTVRDGDGDTDDFVFSVTVRAGDATPITLTSETLNVTSVSTSDATTMLTSTVAWTAAASGVWITDVDSC